MSEEVKLAVECTKAVEGYRDDDAKRRYAQRTRHFLSDITTLGVAHVAAIASARAGKDAVEAGLRAQTCREAVERISQMRLTVEDASYGLYGAVLLYGLKALGVVKAASLADALLELDSPMASSAAYQYALWLKTLAEAYFK